MRRSALRLTVVGLLVLGFLPLAASTVRAGVFCVNPGGTAGCFATFVSAIGAASPGDTINVAAGMYSEFDIVIGKSLTMNGAGAGTTILDAGNTSRRGFIVNSGVTVTIGGLTVRHGKTAGVGGGMVNNGGAVTMQNCIVTDNTAVSGGGIYNAGGVVMLTNTTVTHNSATGSGTYDGGGGVYNDAGTVIATNSAITTNNAPRGGGGLLNGFKTPNVTSFASLYSTNVDGNTGGGSGGGIENGGTLGMNGGSASNNTVGPGYGGGLDNQGAMMIIGATISGNMAGYGGGINHFGTSLTVANTTISGNQAANAGGGIEATALTGLTNVTLTLNSAPNGGGIGIYNGGQHTVLALSGGTLSANTATSKGGGIFLDQDPSHTGIVADITNTGIVNNTANLFGGGLYLTEGSAYITGSLFAYNVGQNGGGGLYVDTKGQLSLVNSTVSTNSLVSGGGGGIASNGTTTLLHDTLAYNAPSNLFNNGGTASVANTIFATTGGANFNCSAASTSLDYNLSNDTSCTPYWTQPHDKNNINPLLDGLINNGGPTLTHALQPLSPAINAIPAAGGCRFGVTTDQRGTTRPQGLTCDIGAFEATLNQTPMMRGGPPPSGSPSPIVLPRPPAPVPPPGSPNQIPAPRS